jgi:hypothetical protein
MGIVISTSRPAIPAVMAISKERPVRSLFPIPAQSFYQSRDMALSNPNGTRRRYFICLLCPFDINASQNESGVLQM